MSPKHPLPFDAKVAPGGYAWWYLDAVSEDGAHALTVIAFVGSVFSPAYARARAAGPADAEDFCAINVALHGPRSTSWVMTEWPRARVQRSSDALIVGDSALHFDGGALVLELDEVTSPFPRRRREHLTGRVRVELQGPGLGVQPLDPAGRHGWYPVAPRAHAIVELGDVRFEGGAYHDANHGREPLEAGFRRWAWCRLAGPRRTRVHYALERRDGSHGALAFEFDERGGSVVELPPSLHLPRTLWGVRRPLPWSGRAAVVRELESSPFYARALLQTGDEAGSWLGVHEALDLDRFSAPWVRFLLPYRMRTVAG